MNYKLLKLSLIVLSLSGILIGCGDDSTSAQHLAAGQKFQNSGDTNAAVIEFKNALKKEPSNVRARLALGLIYQQKGNYVAAKKELSYAINKEETRREAIVPFAVVLSELGESQELIDLPLLVSFLSSENMVQAYYLRGKAYVRLNNELYARSEFKQCIKLPIESKFGLLCAATLALLDKKLDLATQLVSNLLKSNPKMPQALLLSGSIHSVNKQYIKAAAVYEKYIEADNKKIGLVNLLFAQALVNGGKTEEASAELDKILHLNPLQPLANYLKARMLFDQEDFSLAQLHATNTVNALPSHHQANLIGGISAFRESDFDESYRMLSRIEKKISGNTLPVIMNVINNLKLGNIDHARTLLAKAGQLERSNVNLFVVAAREFSVAEDYKTALAILTKARVLNPDSNELKFSIGGIKLRLADRSGLEDLKETLFDPQFSDKSMLLLSAVYIKNGRKNELSEMANQLKIKLPQNKNGWLLAGSIAIDNKQLELAKKEFSHILTIGNDHTAALIHLTKIAIDQQEFTQAFSYVDQALSSEPSNVNLVMLKVKLVFASTKDSKQAENIVIDAYEQFSDNLHLVVERALVYAKNRELKQGILLLASVSDQPGLSNKYWNSYGAMLMADNRNGEALTIYQKWALDKPTTPTPLLKQIALTELMRLYGQGLTIIEQGQKNFGYITQFHLFEVSFLTMANKVKEARIKLDNLVVKDHEDLSYKLVKGELLVAEQHYKSAIEELLPTYQGTKTQRSLRGLAQAYDKLNQQELLIPLLEQHLQDVPTDTMLLPILATAYTKVGQDIKALESYDSLLDKYPQNPVFLNNSAWLLYQKGDYETALKHSTKALELAKDNPQILDTHGMILLKLARVKQASESLEKALLLQPRDFSINAHNAQLALSRGETAKAKFLLNKVRAQSSAEKKLYQEVNQQL